MRTRLLPLLAVLAAGCGSNASDGAPPTPERPAVGTAFEADKVGTVTGRVVWKGPLPKVPTFPHHIPRPEGGFEFKTADNPNRPRIDEDTLAVAGVVVGLRGVDPARSRPWDLPAVAVEMSKGGIVLVQGDRRGRAAFVRRGDAVSITSTDADCHVLRGRGAAFFSLALPEPHRPVSRTLDAPGRVELSSGSWLYWMRADLHVADHPYFAVTDADGRFTLDRVPPGKVEVVASLPGWESAKLERDPDSTSIARMTYTPALERVAAVVVRAGETVDVGASFP